MKGTETRYRCAVSCRRSHQSRTSFVVVIGGGVCWWTELRRSAVGADAKFALDCTERAVGANSHCLTGTRANCWMMGERCYMYVYSGRPIPYYLHFSLDGRTGRPVSAG